MANTSAILKKCGRRAALCAALMALCALSAAAYSKSGGREAAPETVYARLPAVEPAAVQLNDEGYTVILSNGQIFVSPSASPGEARALDGIDVRTLREADRRQLEEGLTLKDDGELSSFIEDFTS